MTSDPNKCGLSSLLPTSCRGRAEAFARRLHSRLSTLGTHDTTDDCSWLTTHENPVAVSQPKHNAESDLYLDLDALESPGSPEEELERSELEKLINKEENRQYTEGKTNKTLLANNVKYTSNDSDSSDSQFYDTTEDAKQAIINGIHKENGEENKTNAEEEIYVTSSECSLSLPHGTSLSEEISTLSLKDDDCSSLTEVTDSEDIREDFESETNSEAVKNGEANNEIKLVISTSQERLDFKDFVANCIDDEDDTETEERIPRVRRCSSLKTGKTPPGTPGRKKIVRFADVLGLDLADVRTFLDEIPKVPNSAYTDLTDVDLNDPASDITAEALHKFHGIKFDKVLVPLFQQPGGQPDFLDRVRENLVCLENALVEDPSTLSVSGTVRVRNLDFHKSVHIRYSLNSWQSFADVQATYVENTCDGFSDKFSFLIYAHTLTVGQRLEFAVRFQCKGCQYWDSNRGANYCFQCLPASNNTTSVTPITGVDDNWGASFY